MSDNNVRRLPVYLVLDVSGSMTGEPIESVRQGVKALLSDLRGDPVSLESVYLSIITFSSGAQQTPLTDLASFQEPNLSANGSTAMGAALKLLDESIDKDVRKSSEQVKGDYRPIVFLMTDGQPTDEWEAYADKIKTKKLGNIIACAAGRGADKACLQRITETVIELQSLQPDQMKSFFRWVSSSIKVASVKVTSGSNGGGAQLPPLPGGLNVVV